MSEQWDPDDLSVPYDLYAQAWAEEVALGLVYDGPDDTDTDVRRWES